MPQYADPNELIAQQIGNGLAQLFAPRSNEAKMKYMLAGSQIAQNDAQAYESRAKANLDEQQFQSLSGFTPDAVSQAYQIDSTTPQGLALSNLFANALQGGGNADQRMDAINSGMGGNILRTATTEGEARRGYALTGHDAPVANALTQPGIAGVFAQETSLNDADNETEMGKARIAARAAMYGHDRDYEASVFGHNRDYDAARYKVDNTLFNVGEKSRLVDRQGNERARGVGAGAGAGGMKELTPTEAAGLRKGIDDNVPFPTEGVDLTPAVEYAGQIFRKTGDASAAIREAVSWYKRDKDGQWSFLAPSWRGTPPGQTPAPGTRGVGNFEMEPDVPPSIAAEIAQAVANGGDFHITERPPSVPGRTPAAEAWSEPEVQRALDNARAAVASGRLTVEEARQRLLSVGLSHAAAQVK